MVQGNKSRGVLQVRVCLCVCVEQEKLFFFVYFFVLLGMEASVQRSSQRSSEDTATGSEGWVLANIAEEVGSEEERLSPLNEFEEISQANAGDEVQGVAHKGSTVFDANTQTPATTAAVDELSTPRAENASLVRGGWSDGDTDTDTEQETFVSVAASRRSSTSLFLSVPASPGPAPLPGFPIANFARQSRGGMRASMAQSRQGQDSSESVFATPATSVLMSGPTVSNTERASLAAPSAMSFETAGSFVFSPATPMLAHGSSSGTGASTPVLVSTPSPRPDARQGGFEGGEPGREVEEQAERGLDAAVVSGCMSPFEPVPSMEAKDERGGMSEGSMQARDGGATGGDRVGESEEENTPLAASLHGKDSAPMSGPHPVTGAAASTAPETAAAPTSLTPLLRPSSSARPVVAVPPTLPRTITPMDLLPPGLLTELMHDMARTLMRSYHGAARVLARVAAAVRRFGRWVLRRRSPTSTSTKAAPPRRAGGSRSPPSNGPGASQGCSRLGPGL